MNFNLEESVDIYDSYNHSFFNEFNDYCSFSNELTSTFKNNDLINTFETNLDSKEKKKEIKLLNEKKNILTSKKEKISKNKNKTKTTRSGKIEDRPLRKKVKEILVKNALNFINKKIKFLYNNNIGNGVCIKELKTLQSNKFNVEDNKKFLYETIGDYFSESITKKSTNLEKSHNKNLINKLLNEKDIIKKKYFEELFKLTFFQFLQHFRGEKSYDVLVGAELYINEIQKYSSNKDYQDELKRYIFEYENILARKRARDIKKKQV